MFCPNCGYKNEDNAKFCEQCSTSLQKHVSDAEVIPKEISNNSAKKHHHKKLVLIPLVIIILLGLGAGGYFFVVHQQEVKAEEAYAAQISTADQDVKSKDYDTAIALYQSAIKKKPKDEKAYLGLADAYIGKNDYEKATKVLNDGYSATQSNALKSKLDETQKVYKDKQAQQEYDKQLAAAKQYVQNKDYDNAAAAYQKALNIHPENADLYLGIANAYSGKSNYEQAISILQKGYDKTKSTDIQSKLSELKKEQQIFLLKEYASHASSSNRAKKLDLRYLEDENATCRFLGALIVDCNRDGNYILIESYSYDNKSVDGFGTFYYDSVYTVQNGKVIPFGGQNILDKAYAGYNWGNGGSEYAGLVKNKDDGKYYFTTGGYSRGEFDYAGQNVGWYYVGDSTYYKVSGNTLKQVVQDKWEDNTNDNGQCTFNGKPVTKEELDKLKEGSYTGADIAENGSVAVLN